MEKQKFYKGLAIIYFVVMAFFVILLWGTGLVWDIIDVFVEDQIYNFYERFSEVVDWTYFIVSFLTIFIKASFIYHKGLSLENRRNG